MEGRSLACAPPEHSQDDVSIECLRSSEFVVGKQTNFNGPVTIVNCADAPQGIGPEKREENIVIRDKVVSPATDAAERGTGAAPREFRAASMETISCRGVISGLGKTFREILEKGRNFIRDKVVKFATVPLFIGIGLLGIAAIALALFFALEYTKAETPEDNASDGGHFYSKADWGGKPPTSVVQMKLPVPYVVVSHSVTPLCHSLATCTPLIQNMQNYHFTLNFADVAYNFLIDSEGNIYEGRGWTRRNVNGGFVNSRNIDACLIGDYSQSIRPRHALMKGLSRLLDLGQAGGYIAPDYALLAANSTYSTLSPGKNVYRIIKDWPHFDPQPETHIREYDE